VDNKRQIKVDTKVSKIYQVIKKDILSAKMRPGEKLVAARMAEEFGTSVIPVREAFNQLKAEGFLEVIPHTGAFVRDMDFDYLVKIYPIRGLLEGYATRLACNHLTEKDFSKLEQIYESIETIVEGHTYSTYSKLNYQFHMSIYRSSGNEPLVKIIEDLMEATHRVRYAYDLMPERTDTSNIEHKSILEALKKRKADQAESEIRKHIDITLEIFVKAFSRNNKVL